MAITGYPDSFPATPTEKNDLREFLEALRSLRSGGGWGRLIFEYKGGDLTDLEITMTKKPKFTRKPAMNERP
jgi:hypothetical protein